VCAIPLLAQPVGTPTPEDIEAAITWGTEGRPTAYLLHHRSLDPARANPWVVGAVYTPFLRVESCRWELWERPYHGRRSRTLAL